MCEFVRLNTNTVTIHANTNTNIITIYYYYICKSNSFKSWLLRSQPGLLAPKSAKKNCFSSSHKYAFVVRRLLAVQRIVDQWFSGILQQILNEFGNRSGNALSSLSPEESLGILLRLETVEDSFFITLRNICHRFAWFRPFLPPF
jgi:hypothetical protein